MPYSQHEYYSRLRTYRRIHRKGFALRIKALLASPFALSILLALIAVCAVSAGSVSVPAGDTLAIITAKLTGNVPAVDPAVTDIIWTLRVPRVLLAMTAGAGLALAGVVMQASVQNPLAEPFILGIASGASVGATLAILIGSAAIPFGVPGCAFLGAIFLVVADLLARTLLPAGDLPIGIITALIGAPLFMKLLFGSGGNFGGGK